MLENNNVDVYFYKNTAMQISMMARCEFKTISNVINLLISSALKYNYTQDDNFRYIPCKSQHTPKFIEKYPPEQNTSSKKRCKYKPAKLCHAKVVLNSKNQARIKKLLEQHHFQNASQAIRILTETAIEYDYNDNLSFRKPIQISAAEYSPINNNKSNNKKDRILLDFI